MLETIIRKVVEQELGKNGKKKDFSYRYCPDNTDNVAVTLMSTLQVLRLTLHVTLSLTLSSTLISTWKLPLSQHTLQ